MIVYKVEKYVDDINYIYIYIYLTVSLDGEVYSDVAEGRSTRGGGKAVLKREEHESNHKGWHKKNTEHGVRGKAGGGARRKPREAAKADGASRGTFNLSASRKRCAQIELGGGPPKRTPPMETGVIH